MILLTIGGNAVCRQLVQGRNIVEGLPGGAEQVTGSEPGEGLFMLCDPSTQQEHSLLTC